MGSCSCRDFRPQLTAPASCCSNYRQDPYRLYRLCTTVQDLSGLSVLCKHGDGAIVCLYQGPMQHLLHSKAKAQAPAQREGAAGTIEAVIIPVRRPNSSRPRTTLCISSQVGCAQNCQFCLTGRMGLQGNLSTAQIMEQVTHLRFGRKKELAMFTSCSL